MADDVRDAERGHRWPRLGGPGHVVRDKQGCSNGGVDWRLLWRKRDAPVVPRGHPGRVGATRMGHGSTWVNGGVSDSTCGPDCVQGALCGTRGVNSRRRGACRCQLAPRGRHGCPLPLRARRPGVQGRLVVRGRIT